MHPGQGPTEIPVSYLSSMPPEANAMAPLSIGRRDILGFEIK